LDEQGFVVIIEPALKKQTRRLMHLRNQLIEKKKGCVLLPCLHAQECPLSRIRKGREWCHQTITWKPPEYMRLLNQGMNREINKLKYSFLVIAKCNYGIHHGNKLLVVSKLLTEKGKKRCFLCTPAGRIELSRLDRFKSSVNASFDHIKKGDIVTLKNVVQKKQGLWRITDETQCSILQ
jgi:hypothetical protein